MSKCVMCSELSIKLATGELLADICSVSQYLVMEMDRGFNTVLDIRSNSRVTIRYELNVDQDLIINIESDYKQIAGTVVIDATLSDTSNLEEPTQAYVFVRRADDLEIIRTEIEEFLDWRL